MLKCSYEIENLRHDGGDPLMISKSHFGLTNKKLGPRLVSHSHQVTQLVDRRRLKQTHHS